MLPIPLFANRLTRMFLILAIHGFAMFFACLPVSEYARAEQPLYMNGDQSDQVEGTQIQGQLFHDGLKRTYLLYVPATLDQSKAAPLVMVFHGGFGSGSRIARHIGMNRVADREKFLVVYPDGVDRHWNDGRSTTASGADDVSFVLALTRMRAHGQNCCVRSCQFHYAGGIARQLQADQTRINADDKW